MKVTPVKIFSLLLLLLFTTSTMAIQGPKMKGTAITGNRELPKVLYIVPWKSTETVDIQSPPVKSIMDQELIMLERNAFMREVRYYNMFFPASTDSVRFR